MGFNSERLNPRLPATTDKRVVNAPATLEY